MYAKIPIYSSDFTAKIVIIFLLAFTFGGFVVHQPLVIILGLLDAEIAGHGVHGDEWLVEPFVQAGQRNSRCRRIGIQCRHCCLRHCSLFAPVTITCCAVVVDEPRPVQSEGEIVDIAVGITIGCHVMRHIFALCFDGEHVGWHLER